MCFLECDKGLPSDSKSSVRSKMLKFFLAIDGARGPALLTEQSLRLMRQAPAHLPVGGAGPASYYGLGVHVFRHGQGDNWWHDGSQPGLMSLAVRSSAGYSWVVALNLRPRREDRAIFFSELDQGLWRAARSVAVWPEGDLF